MGPTGFPETSVTKYLPTQHKMAGD